MQRVSRKGGQLEYKKYGDLRLRTMDDMQLKRWHAVRTLAQKCFDICILKNKMHATSNK